MKNRKIDSKLLERYVNNTCTAQERYLIEQWLNTDSFDEIEVPVSFETSKEQLKNEIWDSLLPREEEKRRKKTYSFFPHIYRYAVSAAILLLLIAFGFLQRETKQEKEEESPLQIVQVCDRPTFIPVKNDAEIIFVSETSEQNKLYQKIACKEGNTYLAIKIKFKSEEELLVVNEKDIQNLPPFLNLYISNQIKG